MLTFKIEQREETIAKYRADFIEQYKERAFNFDEALREFDKDPESFDMVFYTLKDMVIEKLKEHSYRDKMDSYPFDPWYHICNHWGWLCKPGEYPTITF